MMRALGLRQGFRCSLSQQRLYVPPLCLDLIQAKIGCARAGDHDEIHAVGQKTWPGAKALPAESLHAVSAHGGADCARNDEAEPGRVRGRALPRDEQREMPSPYSSSRPLCLHELRMFAQPSPSGELEGQTPLLLVNRGHQVPATLSAAVLKHLATPPCGHPSTKAMGARPANVVRLVGTLHEKPHT
jgi:hypothetical protein